MKRPIALVTLVFLMEVYAGKFLLAADSNDYLAVERGPHHRVWARIGLVTNQLGQVHLRTNNFTELASGLHVWTGNNWVEANPRIIVTNNGAIGYGAQHVVAFGANLNRRGAIQIRTPEGVWLKSHVLGLAYHDRNLGTNVLIAQVKDSFGQLVGSNQVVYADAFQGVQADVKYRYRKAGIEQDIILRQRPPMPQQFALDPSSTHLLAITEFVESPAPQIEDQNLPVGSETMTDQTVAFGSLRTVAGRAFSIGNRARRWEGAPVYKTWENWQGRTLLIERVRFQRVRDELLELPVTTATNVLAAAVSGTSTKWFASGTVPVEERLAESEARPLRQMAALSERNGFVMDYDLVYSTSWGWDFYCDNTYLINDECHITGSIYFEPGAILKFDQYGKLFIDGGFYFDDGWDCNGFTKVMLTSAADDSIGEQGVPRSACPPCGCFEEPAVTVRPQYLALAQATFVANTGYGCLGVVAGSPYATVTNYNNDAIATKGTMDKATFRISREAGDYTQPMTVNFVVSGTAVAGVDYVSIGTSATIDASEGYVDVEIAPAAESGVVYDSTVTLTLVAGSGYMVGSSASKTVTIYDPSVPAPPGVLALPELAGWWRAENNANDSKGVNHGVLDGVGFTYGKVAQGFSFDGVDDRVVITPVNSTLDFGAGADFSIEAWIRPETATTAYGVQTIVDKRDTANPSTATGYAFFLTYGKLSCQLAVNGAYANFAMSSPDLRDSAWHHVAVTVDRDSATGLKFYVDGALVGTFNPTSRQGSLINTKEFRIGNHAQSGLNAHMKGVIDEASVYNRMLTGPEVQSIFGAGRGGKYIDSDSDGLSDFWEQKYFGGLGEDGNGDFDCDGLTNSQEFQTPSNPAVPNAPVIFVQPQDQGECEGSSGTFTVTPVGGNLSCYSFQWRFNGANIAGATSSSYTRSGLAITDMGDYTVVVSSAGGTITSAAAKLKVLRCTPVSFPNFANTSLLQINGNASPASTADGSILQLTPSYEQKAGSIFLKQPMRLQNNGSFSTYFAFRLSLPGGTWEDADSVPGADGITFTVHTSPSGSTALGLTGGNLGYMEYEDRIDKSFTVEFDTWYNFTPANPGPPPVPLVSYDPTLPGGIGDGNHIELAFDGLRNFVEGQHSPIAAAHVEPALNNGDIWYAWIDYDGMTELLEVRLSRTSIRPASPKLSHNFRALDHLTSADAYVGFTGATGPIFNQQDILFWHMRPYYEPLGSGENHSPTLTSVSTLPGGAENAVFEISYATLKAASDAYDEDGDPISFRITSISSGTLRDQAGNLVADTTFQIEAGETYTWTPPLNKSGAALNAFQVRATDGRGGESVLPAVQVRVQVSADNNPPTVNAGEDVSLPAPNPTIQVTLPQGLPAGTLPVADDAKLNLTPAIRWSRLSGTGNVTFGTPTTDGYVTATFDTPGEYILMLTANDGEYESSDTVKVRVCEQDAEIPLDIAVLLDTSNSMDGQPLVDAKRALREILGKIRFAGDNSSDAVCLVPFTDSTEWGATPFLSDPSVLVTAIDALEIKNHSAMTVPFTWARTQLKVRAKSRTARPLILIVSDFKMPEDNLDGLVNAQPPGQLANEVALAKAEGVRIITVGFNLYESYGMVGSGNPPTYNIGADLMYAVASSSEDAHEATKTSEFSNILNAFRRVNCDDDHIRATFAYAPDRALLTSGAASFALGGRILDFRKAFAGMVTATPHWVVLESPAGSTVSFVPNADALSPTVNISGGADHDDFKFQLQAKINSTVVGYDETTTIVLESLPNRPPLPIGDIFKVREDSLDNLLDVLRNDSDPDGEELEIAAVESPPHGTANIVNSGKAIMFTPDPDYQSYPINLRISNWLDGNSFSYTVSDGAVSEVVKVVVIVTPEDDPATATEDEFIAYRSSPWTVIEPLKNDKNIDTDEGFDEKGQVVGVHGYTLAEVSPLIRDGGGYPGSFQEFHPGDTSLKYVPDPLATENYIVHFTYKNQDPHGNRASAEATILVVTTEPANHEPEPRDDFGFAWQNPVPGQDSVRTFDVLANDTDPDDNPLEFYGIAVGSVPSGESTNWKDYFEHQSEDRPDHPLKFHPKKLNGLGNASLGDYVFQYTVRDDDGYTHLQAAANLVISVITPGPLPTAGRDTAQVQENGSVVIDPAVLTQNDFGDAIVFSWALTGAANGAVEVITSGPDTGKIRYTPTADYYGADSFTYKIIDAHKRAATGKVDIIVYLTDGNAPQAAFAPETITPGEEAVRNESGTDPVEIVRDGIVQLVGIANDDDLQDAFRYELEIVSEASIVVASATSEQRVKPAGPLARLDLRSVPDGVYTVRLTVHGGIETAEAEKFIVLQSNHKIGNLKFSETDLTVNFGGAPINVVRSYDSINGNAGKAADYGPGWTFDLTDLQVQIDETRELVQDIGEDWFSRRTGGGRNLSMTMPDGRKATFRFKFEDNASPATFLHPALWAAPPGVAARLTTGANEKFATPSAEPGEDPPPPYWYPNPTTAPERYDIGHYLLTFPDGTVFHIDRDYEGEHYYLDIGAENDFYVESYGKARLTEVDLPTGAHYYFSPTRVDYEAPGQTPRPVLLAIRDGNGLITAVHDRTSLDNDGNPIAGKDPAVLYEYQPLAGQSPRLIKVRRLRDRATDGHNATYDEIKYEYDKDRPYLLTGIIDARGVRVANTIYDDQGRIIKLERPDGRWTEYHHDDPPTATAAGAVARERLVDSEGLTTVHETDARGNVVLTIDALGNRAARTFDDRDAVLSDSLTDPQGNLVSKTVNTLKRLAANHTRNPDGIQYRLVESGINPDIATRSFEEYDELGHLTRTIDPKNCVGIVNLDSSPDVAFAITNHFDPTTGQPTVTQVARGGEDAEILSRTTYYTSAFPGMVHEQIDVAGTKSVYEYYDGTVSKGRFGDIQRIRTFDSAGTQRSETEFEYDEFGHRTKEIRKQNSGGSWVEYASAIYRYDDRGHVIETVDLEGGHTTTGYDSDGRTIASTNRYGAETYYTYDAVGELIETKYPDGTISRSATFYEQSDQLSPQLRRTVKQDRHVAGGTANGDLTLYDTVGRVVATDRLKGVVIDLVQDGPVQKAIFRGTPDRMNGSYGTDHDSNTTYDAAGRVWKTADAIQQSRHRPTEFFYDSNGRRWKTLVEPGAFVERVSLTGYDQNGNQLWTLDPNQYQEIAGTGYDVERGGSTVNVAFYDLTAEEAKTVLEMLEQDRLTWWTYDEFNRVTRTDLPRVELGTGIVGPPVFAEARYDAAGRRWLEVDADRKATAFAYDDLGRLAWVITDVDPEVGALPATWPTTTTGWETWAANGRVTASESSATHYVYDDFGRLVQQTDAKGNPTSFEYDKLDRRTRRTLPGGSYEAWTNDLNVATGEPSTANPRPNKFRHRDFAGRFTLTSHDINGRLVSRQTDGQEAGVTPLPAQASRGVSFTYTSTGLRASMSEGPNQPRNTYYAYDGFGRLRIKQQPEGTIYYDCNAIGNVTEISARRYYPAYANSAWHVFDLSLLGEPDGANARPDGAHMIYQHDVLHRVGAVYRNTPGVAGSTVAIYGFDHAGNLTSVDYGDTTQHLITTYQYDARNHLRRLNSFTMDDQTEVPVASYDYDNVLTGTGLNWTGRGLAASGLRRGVAELVHYGGHDHQRTIAYDYDGLNRLRAERIRTGTDAWPAFAPTALPGAPASGDVLYDVTPGYGDATGYDRVGNRNARTASGVSGVATRSYAAYDANDRLGSALATGTTAATYDANGNTLQANSGNDAAWDEAQADQYDFENRLFAATRAGHNITIVYDGDGNRVSKTVDGTTTRYLVDDRNPTGYAQVLEEQDSSGNPLATYIYGLDLLTQTRNIGTVSSPNWQTHYFGYDGHGSVRYLTADADGAPVTDIYNYDAFGVLTESWHAATATENHYLYSGEQWDNDLGLYYLRARYLNPDSGRFWTMDTFEGNTQDPLSLHKYLYAHADPVNNNDPSGNFTSTIEFAISSTIALNIRATWEANRVRIYGGAIAAALAVATYYGGSWALEEARQLAIARSALAAAGTSVANEIAKAKQILRTRRGNWRPPKIVPMPMSIIPAVAQNVAVGQLTTPGPLRRVGILQTIKNRYFATRSRGSAGPGMSWDEYPFASTAQGGSPAVVRPVPEKQNWIQGGIIAAAYVAEKISPGDWFEVVITP